MSESDENRSEPDESPPPPKGPVPTDAMGGVERPAPGPLDPLAAERFSTLEVVGHNSRDLIIVLDDEGTIIYGNPVAQELFGLTPEVGVGANALDFVHPEDAPRVAEHFEELLTTPGASVRDTIRALKANGEIRELEIVSTNSFDHPLVRGVVINGRDVTQRNLYHSQLEMLEERFRLAFEENMAPMSFADHDDHILAVNDAFCQMTGYGREELLGHDSTLFTFPEDFGITEESHRRAVTGDLDHVRYVKRYRCKDGRVIVVEISRAPARDAEGNIIYFVFSERDITEERALTAQLSRQALQDPLTGLANRTLFEDRLLQAHARVVRRGGLGAVFLMDLDDFKGVNDTYGHVVGDELLRSIGRRLEGMTRSSDTLCRFGGDEFLYLAEELTDAREVDALAERILNALNEPFDIAGASLTQRASLGAAVWDSSRQDTSALIQDADVALYEAKRLGRGRYVTFTPTMHNEAANRFTLIQELAQAEARGELAMYFQPLIELATGSIRGFEALMRWRHPTRGMVPPDVFIPLAEQNHLIVELGAFAIREALAAAASFDRDGDGDGDGDAPYVSVNLSARQFHDPHLVTSISSALEESGVAPRRLVLEVTETVALTDVSQTRLVMTQLHRLGVGVALDDFGTGFSSLSYLVHLRPRIIKIDQSFVRPTSRGPESDAILELIVLLGRKLNMAMVAEGVETVEQLERLRSFECEYGQGFFWSPAVPLDEVSNFFRSGALAVN